MNWILSLSIVTFRLRHDAIPNLLVVLWRVLIFRLLLSLQILLFFCFNLVFGHAWLRLSFIVSHFFFPFISLSLVGYGFLFPSILGVAIVILLGVFINTVKLYELSSLRAVDTVMHTQHVETLPCFYAACVSKQSSVFLLTSPFRLSVVGDCVFLYRKFGVEVMFGRICLLVTFFLKIIICEIVPLLVKGSVIFFGKIFFVL